MKKLMLLMLLPCLAQAQLINPMSVKESQLTWEGRNVMGGGHTGMIAFKYGTITTKESGEVTKGEFVLDMHAIENTDIDDKEGAKGLIDHLKSDDFFSVDKHPTASFVITSVTPAFKFPNVDQYTVTGKLTIKNITHIISFPAVITENKGVIKAEATLTIDRTKWKVNYQSQSVFGTLKDSAISDEVVIKLQLVFDGC